MPTEDETRPGEGGVVVYWGVENAELELARIHELGGTPRNGVQDVGGGIKVASVSDPFGNIFGIIENSLFQLPSRN